MASVQFYSRDSVLSAYKHRGISCWAVFDGKELLCPGDGLEDLEQFLDMLGQGASSATYSLRVYIDVADPDLITDKTPSNGGFKFKLLGNNSSALSNNDSGVRNISGYSPAYSRLHQLVDAKVGAAIEKMLDKSDNEEDDEAIGAKEKEESLEDVVMGLLRDPERLVGLIGSVRSLFSGSSVVKYAAGTNVSRAGVGATNDVDPAEKLATAIDVLEKHDPNLVTHLMKLASLAETDPITFKLIISKLDVL